MITKWSYEKIQKTVFQFSKKVEPVVDIEEHDEPVDVDEELEHVLNNGDVSSSIT